MKKFTPTYHAQNIYEVPIDFFKKVGIKNVLIDLDNTLASYRQHSADANAKAYIKGLLDFGYNVIIVSNNKGARVASYAQSANVEYRANMRKPLKFKLKRLLEEKQFETSGTILIGDQLLTDVLLANRVGIRSLLTEKLVKEDQWTTHFNRLLDRPLRRKLKKKNKLNDWRTSYGSK